MLCNTCKNKLSIIEDIGTHQFSIRCKTCLVTTQWCDTFEITMDRWEHGDVVGIKDIHDFHAIRKSKSNYAAKQAQFESDDDVPYELETEDS